MSELNVNDLPIEILTEIFRFLPVVDLKNATLACKLWNNLIESECRWSLILFQRMSESTFNSVLTTNRKFGTISFIGRMNQDQILQVLRKQGYNVVKLILLSCRIDTLGALAEILNLTPNLKDVTITNDFYKGATETPLDQVLPELKRLKKLKMSARDQGIYRCFQQAKLTTMIIDENIVPSDFGPLVDFLSLQDTLASLSLSYHSLQSILAKMKKSNASFPFRLTYLEISYVDLFRGFISHDHDNVLEFLKSQVENLRKIKLRDFPNYIYRHVFASMAKLNSLTVDIYNYTPPKYVFYEQRCTTGESSLSRTSRGCFGGCW